MGEQMLRTRLEGVDWGSRVQVSSAGTSRWEVGNPIDERAAKTLLEHGYPPFSGHIAKTVAQEHVAADLILALDESHQRALLDRGAPVERLRLLRSFDPEASGTEIADPYYGGLSGFERTLAQIEAALPGIMAWLESRLT
jgi:protein-tyrosine phosphatase